MSDGSDLEKTEPPTPRRLQKAREDGQVARSRELTTFVALLAGGIGFAMLGARWVSHTTGSLKQGLVLTHRDAFDAQALGDRLASFASDALVAVVPMLLLVAGAAIAGSALLGGFFFSAKAFTFDPSRLSPIRGLKRTWSTDGLSELVKAIVKSGLLGAIAAWILWKDRDTFAGIGAMSLGASLTMLGRLMVEDFLLLTGGLALIAALDAPVQLWRHHQSLKMTKQDLRDEARESDGDPARKSRIRSLRRLAMTRRLTTDVTEADVTRADVVVVDARRYAVAIAYNAAMPAPKVVAKGSALKALRLHELADAHRIPIVEAPPLARALHKHADLGREIPIALYEAVALVMAYVIQVERQRTEGGARPSAPVALPVPAELDFKPAGRDAKAEGA